MKSALTVGINTYRNAPLQGCVNDAHDWAELLTERGYEVTIVTDHHATKDTIVKHLKQLVADARFGDRIVFTYSGHGTWLPDTSGDEPDRRDEALCAIDYETGGLIKDDELNAIFESRRFGVRVTIISDSCHSGTVSRFLTPRARPRYLSPFEFLTGEELLAAKRVFNGRAVTTPRKASGTALLSGCKDDEYSYDAYINDRWNGAFTQAAIRVHKLSALPLSYSRWHKAISAFLPSYDYPQSPQLFASLWQRTWKL